MNQVNRGTATHWCGVVLIVAILLTASVGAFSNPSVIHRSPARGEELLIDGFVEIVFDDTMDRPSVEAAWSIDPRIDGTFDWPTEQTLRFTPVSGWTRDTIYTISVSQDALSSMKT